ncbi:hypothetical protein C8R45DRAFT_5903 [Mycena sanguinolenta]|nr:hypothetical protein C8R45DRAFT_5903 [Mycena sanguinolenta]
MLNPWVLIDAALEAATPPLTAPRAKWGASGVGDVNIGDIAICREGSRLRYVFYEYLLSNGYVLTKEERRIFDILKLEVETEPVYARPCVVLERHPHGLFKVCYKATLDDDSNASVFSSLSIPADDVLHYPLKNSPSRDLAEQRVILPFPVMRSNLVPVRRSLWLREHLNYGELERVKTLIQEKIEIFASGHKEFRRKELALRFDPAHPGNRAKEKEEPRLRPSKRAFRMVNSHLKRYNHPKYFTPIFKKSRFIPSRVVHRNNIQWVLQHAKEDIVAASSYLSSVEHPSPSLFHLPRPFYSTLLRASSAFVRRRIGT